MLKQTETEETKSIAPVGTPEAQVPTTQAKPTPLLQQRDLKSLTRKFSSRNPAVRAEAEQMLRDMDVPTLLSLMTLQRQLRRQKFIGIGVVAVPYCLLLMLAALWLQTPMFGMFWIPLLGGVLGALVFTPMQKSAAMELGRREDLQSVGELVAALEMRDEEVQRIVRPALTRLLPRLRSTDTSLLTEAQRRVLRQSMENMLFGRQHGKYPTPYDDLPFFHSALKALEQVGDASFIPVVRQWVSGQKYGEDPDLRQAAVECLAYLEQGSLQSHASRELLRASTEDRSMDGKALLRPAAGTKETASEELLRPSDTE